MLWEKKYKRCLSTSGIPAAVLFSGINPTFLIFSTEYSVLCTEYDNTIVLYTSLYVFSMSPRIGLSLGLNTRLPSYHDCFSP